ncbi:13346_t:CDS:2, partial [Entrophospora sp. SA101]
MENHPPLYLKKSAITKILATHQIRVHLQYLGYPIANDPLYCNKKVWGSNLGKGGINEEA